MMEIIPLKPNDRNYIGNAALLVGNEWGDDAANCFADSIVDLLCGDGQVDDFGTAYGCILDRSKLIGVGTISASDISYDIWGMSWIVVDREYRKQGIATEIVSALEKYAAKTKRRPDQVANIVQLTTSVPSFYERIGYQSVMNWRNGHMHLMTKVLEDKLSGHLAEKENDSPQSLSKA